MYQIVEVPILKSDESATIAVAATANVYSHSFVLEYGKNFSLQLQASSAGVVDIDVYLYESNQLPTTEGTLHSSYVIPDNITKLADITNTTLRRLAFSPVVCKYGLLLFDGQGSNDAGTTISGKLFYTIPA